MVNLSSPTLDRVFSALSDPTRRQILGMLNSGKRTVGSLAEPFDMSLAAVSKHVKILEEAKLLDRKKIGRIHECSINPAILKSAEECLNFYTQFWGERLDAFALDLESTNPSPAKRKKRSS